MTEPSPITFKQRAGQGHVALLGVVPIGVAYADERHPRVAAWWVLWLPSMPNNPQRAVTVDEAKQRLTDAAGQWLEAAGLVPAPANDNTEKVRDER